MSFNSVNIHLDRSRGCFTNLDFLTGKVAVHLAADTPISAVTIKLEGESRTRLSGPKLAYNNEIVDKNRTVVEWHKLLYKVETLFPKADFQPQQSNPTYLLTAGYHEYPFRFKFPFNNDCQNNASVRDLKVGGMGIALGSPKPTVQHVKKTLPPSLSGFPGQAEIKYFVKATVARPKFYQENIRSQLDISFLPIEPPKPPDREEETFARREQQLPESAAGGSKLGIFSLKATNADVKQEPLALQVDARLPNPAIITCNKPLPLRVLVQKTPENVFLRMLQIELIGYTYVRAQELKRSQGSSWVIMSQANINLALGETSDRQGRELTVPSRFWDSLFLPASVAPSFDTCNISRAYELEVRVGLSRSKRGESTVFPLRLPVRVFSGITPPPDLLQRVAASQNRVHTHHAPTTSTLDPKGSKPYSQPPTPLTPSYAQQSTPALSGSISANPSPGFFRPSNGSNSAQGGDDDDDAPPSYEDAMADEIAPVDGPRRDYVVPPLPARPNGQPSTLSPRTDNGENVDIGSGKGRLGRAISERLFPNNPGGGRRGGQGAENGRHPSRPSSDERSGGQPAGSGAGGGGQSQDQSATRRPTLPPTSEESRSTSGGGDQKR